jgi:IPT/TIG domain
MSLSKRRMSRRALGVVVGASLLVLGLEAPAFAAPTVTGVTPNSGPDNCVVVIAGTGFLDVPQAQQDLMFDGPGTNDVAVDDANWFALSATEIWAVVPDLTPGNTYTVTVTDPTGGTSTGTFLSTAAAGGCAPTIASVTPTCGTTGDVVTITGTNLIGPDLLGAEVRFSPYADAQVAAHSVPDVDEPTSLSVVVPSGSTDGKIQVTTFDTDAVTAGVQGGIAFSPAIFDISDACVPGGGVTHARSISLTLKKHLIAKGVVTVEDETAECVAGVTVKIQRKKKGGGWKNVGTTTTSDAGKYKRSIKDKPGKYRAVAPALTLEDDTVCTKDVSPRVRHRH